MKRCYRTVGVEPVDSAFTLVLDGKSMPTPARRPMIVPSAALADAIAGEWRAQVDMIKPETMPLTRLVVTAIDRVADHRDQVVAQIASFGQTDLLCYPAALPLELARRQQELWQPLLDWARRRFDLSLNISKGIVPVSQSPRLLGALTAVVAGYDDLTLAALHAATTASGSVIIGLAVVEGQTGVDLAWQASQVDESFQSERWGEDAEARARGLALRAELEAAARLIALAAA